jgi:hypothetical protein
MTDACPPPPAAVVTVARPLSIGLPPEKFDEVVAGSRTVFITKRNPRKDRYFCAKRPLQARIAALGTDRFVLRNIVSIEGTAEEWKVSIRQEPP